MTAERRIRILFVVGTLDVGGTEKQVAETAIRLNRERFLPQIYCFSKGGALVPYLEQHGIHVVLFHEEILEDLSFWHRMKRYVRKFLELFRYIRKMQPDIVHCYLYSPSMFGGLTARLARVPVLITSRRCLGLFKDGHINYQRLENLINRMTDAVLVNSEALRSDVLQREAIPAEKVHVIHNGIDIQQLHPLTEEQKACRGQKKQALGIPEHAYIIGMIANLIPYKGHWDFLSAAAIVAHQYPNVYFLCVGEDRGIQPQLEQYCRELEIQRQVVFTGQVQDIPTLIQLLDVLVSASHQEGFSNTILEGMASGLPIVATAVGGTAEAIIHDRTGLLVAPNDPEALADAMLMLLSDPERATRLGQQARKYAEEQFSMEKMLDKFENLYLRLFVR